MVSLKPLPERHHQFFTILPIQIQLQGQYQPLAYFVSHLALLNWLLRIDDFSLQLASPSISKETVIDLHLTAKYYRYHGLLCTKNCAVSASA